MSKNNNRTVYQRPDGNWNNKGDNADRPKSVHPTQREAEKAAKDIVRNQGGGEVTIKGRDGRIRDRDTVSPGNDPCPPRDRKH